MFRRGENRCPGGRIWISGIRAARVTGGVLAGIFAVSPVLSAEIIGAAETVSNRVIGELPGSFRTLAADSDVHLNEWIRTEAASAARLRFADKSDLRLGPQARIRLDAFVFSGKSSSAMNLARGALRFISGDGPKGSYQIRTPVATIGLRGTAVDVVLRQGRVFVTLLDGAARVCTPSGQCSDLVNRCDYVEAGVARAEPARPLSPNIPTFNAVCSGPGCGQPVCTSSASVSPPSRTATPPGTPARGSVLGYDPAGGSTAGAGGSSGGGGGKGR